MNIGLTSPVYICNHLNLKAIRKNHIANNRKSFSKILWLDKPFKNTENINIKPILYKFIITSIYWSGIKFDHRNTIEKNREIIQFYLK